MARAPRTVTTAAPLELAPANVCGIDEAGRGPWAGPVVVAAVLLPRGERVPGLADSKRLSAERRSALDAIIRDVGLVGVGAASAREVDALNVLQATHLAMVRAVAALPTAPARALVDGNRLPERLGCPAEAVVRGDGRVAQIAAASIVAKVCRDRIMVALAQQYPGYGWERNAGYGVPEHSAALHRLGVTPHHRRSFKPVYKML